MTNSTKFIFHPSKSLRMRRNTFFQKIRPLTLQKKKSTDLPQVFQPRAPPHQWARWNESAWPWSLVCLPAKMLEGARSHRKFFLILGAQMSKRRREGARKAQGSLANPRTRKFLDRKKVKSYSSPAHHISHDLYPSRESYEQNP